MKKEAAKTIRDQIYHKILADIISNEFCLDEFFTEKSLMDKYQASRAPVREALIQLRSKHVVESIHRHGYRICKPSRQEHTDLLLFRSVLEGSFLEQYHYLITPDRIQELREICHQYDEIPRKKFIDYWTTTRSFHLTLFSYYGNEYALSTLADTLDRLAIYFAEIMKDYYVSEDLHSAMLDYLEKGDIKTAKMLLQTDIKKGLSDDVIYRGNLKD